MYIAFMTLPSFCKIGNLKLDQYLAFPAYFQLHKASITAVVYEHHNFVCGVLSQWTETMSFLGVHDNPHMIIQQISELS